jgi:hypothetical protein
MSRMLGSWRARAIGLVAMDDDPPYLKVRDDASRVPYPPVSGVTV